MRLAAAGRALFLLLLSLLALGAARSAAQAPEPLASQAEIWNPQKLAQDQGFTGLYQDLLKLQTTARMMHTAAHPDD